MTNSDFDKLFPKVRSEHEATYLFVDGENLTARSQASLKGTLDIDSHYWMKDAVIWSKTLEVVTDIYFVRRKFYYTSTTGGHEVIENTERFLRSKGFEAPRVFRRKKDSRSKQVDISLTAEVLKNLFNKNFKNMILVTGDEDYVPLIETAQDFGARVVLWSIPSGLSPRLVAAADAFCDVSDHLFDASVVTQSDGSGVA